MTKKKIRDSLLKQLENNGFSGDYATDLIDDYLILWDLKNKLKKDIKTRGIVYRDKSSTGVEIQKNNPSNKELLFVNRQMLTILKELKLNNPIGFDGEDDEL